MADAPNDPSAAETAPAPSAGRVAIGVVFAAAAGAGAWLGLAQTVPAWGERLLFIALPIYVIARIIAGALPRGGGGWAQVILLALVVPGAIAGGASYMAGQLGGTIAWWPEVAVYSLFGLSAFAIAYAIRLAADGFACLLVEGKALRAVIGGVITIVVALPFLAATLQAHRVKIGNATGPDVTHEEVSFETADGLTIRGWYLPGAAASEASPRPAIVFAHGVSANRSNFLPIALIPHQLGYPVLIFDMRGHGDSDGRTVTFGPHEARDVAAATAWLAARPEVDGDRIVAMGCSMGSAAVMHAAASDPERFAGIILDSPLADVDLVADDLYGFMPAAIRRPFLEGIFAVGRLHLEGEDLRDHEPQDVAAKVTAPVLLIHGTADRILRIEQAGRLHEVLARAGNEPQLEIFEGAPHAGAAATDHARYGALLSNFLERTAGPSGR